jgi:PAP2 superfamily
MSTRMALVLVLTLGLMGSGEAQTSSDANCTSATGQQLSHDMRWMGRGILLAPKHAIQPGNLKWEIPVVAATALMINYGDTPASRQIQNIHVENAANRFSDIGQYGAWGLAGALYAFGCAKHRDGLRSTGLQALEAGASAMAIDSLLKVAANRVRPDLFNSQGNFWDAGGRSFASGHAAVSFAIASVLAHHTQDRWKKVAIYGLAGAVSFARFPAKKHFLSDILVGSTIGYVTGTYIYAAPPMSTHTAPAP